jgi:hypothetical protein
MRSDDKRQLVFQFAIHRLIGQPKVVEKKLSSIELPPPLHENPKFASQNGERNAKLPVRSEFSIFPALPIYVLHICNYVEILELLLLEVSKEV